MSCCGGFGYNKKEWLGIIKYSVIGILLVAVIWYGLNIWMKKNFDFTSVVQSDLYDAINAMNNNILENDPTLRDKFIQLFKSRSDKYCKCVTEKMNARYPVSYIRAQLSYRNVAERAPGYVGFYDKVLKECAVDELMKSIVMEVVPVAPPAPPSPEPTPTTFY